MPRLAAVSSARFQRVTPSRSASASTANATTHDTAIWYGPETSQTAGCRLCGPGICSDRPSALIRAAHGSRMMAVPGSEIKPVPAA